MASFLQLASLFIIISRSSLADDACLYHSCECGVYKKPNITTLENDRSFYAGQAEYPFVVILTTNDAYRCIGSVITIHDVVTAAHCVYNVDPRVMKIRVGDWYNLVSSIVIHEGYSSNTRENNIALVITEADIASNIVMPPVCLPISSALKPKFPYGSPDDFNPNIVTLLGYAGERSSTGVSRLLKKVELPIISTENCRQKIGDDSSKLKLCLLDEEKKYKPEACLMDSGGPILWQINKQNRLQLIGIVTSGPVCGEPMPSVNTFIPLYLDWLLDNIEGYYLCSGGFILQSRKIRTTKAPIVYHTKILEWQRYPYTSKPFVP